MTGGFGVLGRAVATARGAHMVRIDLAPAPAGAAATDLGGVDITDADAAAKAVQTIV